MRVIRGGNATTYHHDGSRTNWNPDSPEHAAISCGCAEGAHALNEWNRNWRGVRSDLALLGVEEASFTGAGFEFNVELGHGSHIPTLGTLSASPISPGHLVLNNPGYVAHNPVLSLAWNRRSVSTGNVMSLERIMTIIHNNSIRTGTEWGATLALSRNGAIVAIAEGNAFNGGRAHSIDITVRRTYSGSGVKIITVHGHPWAGHISYGLKLRGGTHHGAVPSKRDVTAAIQAGYPGFVVARGGAVYGYDANGF